MTTNAVKTRLYSARQHLRQHMNDIEKRLEGARPSSDSTFADKVARMIQPEALKQKKPWLWSPGIGTDVWALFCACITGDLETVKQLVGKDPSLARAHYEYRTPLSFAVRENHMPIADFLLEHGAEPLALGDVLEMARDRGYVEMTQLLERKLASIHGASSEGEPLATAIRARDLARVRRVLDQSPQLVRAGDGRSNQPIHWAVMTWHLPIIDELLSRGADIDARRPDGARPIQLTNGDYHYRGWRDVPEDVVTTPDDAYRHLVARGAYVDIGIARDEEWRSTPLAWAARAGQTRMVEFLLRRGARPSLPDDPPWATPKAWAEKRGHEAIVRLLDEYERSGALPPRRLEAREALARDLVDAYGPADSAALQRIVEYFHVERLFTWDRPSHEVRVARLRKGVLDRLRDRRNVQTTETSLAIEDARWLIARAEGFESWKDLINDVES